MIFFGTTSTLLGFRIGYVLPDDTLLRCPLRSLMFLLMMRWKVVSVSSTELVFGEVRSTFSERFYGYGCALKPTYLIGRATLTSWSTYKTLNSLSCDSFRSRGYLCADDTDRALSSHEVRINSRIGASGHGRYLTL